MRRIPWTTRSRPASFGPGRVDAPASLLWDAGTGVVCALAGALVRVALSGVLEGALLFLTFYPAVAVASWAGGMAGGVAAAIVSVVLAEAIAGSPWPLASADALGAVVFLLASLLIAWLGQMARAERRAAQRTAGRARFVADAARLLQEPVERDVTLDALARIVVPAFADWCVIDLVDHDGRFRWAVIRAPDERQRAVAEELRQAYPHQPDAPAGVAWVARTGQVEAVLDVPPGFFDAIPDPRLRELMRSLGFRSFASVPMTAPGRGTVGVLTVVMAGSGRRLTADDVELVADLGRRTAVAVDHAELIEAARAGRKQLEAVIAAIPEALLIAGPDGTVEVANDQATRLVGEVRGSPLRDVVQALRSVDGRTDVVATEDGRYVAPHLIEADVDGLPVAFGMLVDRTELVESEAARDVFLGMLSHELRTPLTTIYASAQLLRKAPTGDRRAELTEELAAETDRLIRLVDDLLVLSRFERGRLEASLEPMLPGRIIAAAAAAEAQLHPGLEISVDAPANLPTVLGDETYLRQIARNLLSNAAKYAGPNARVHITVSEAAGRVRATFEDDGPGVDPAAADRLFGLFERLPAHRDRPGAGIGLFVRRRLAEVMGGSLTVDTGTGGGACFLLDLPASTDDDPHDLEHHRDTSGQTARPAEAVGGSREARDHA